MVLIVVVVMVVSISCGCGSSNGAGFGDNCSVDFACGGGTDCGWGSEYGIGGVTGCGCGSVLDCMSTDGIGATGGGLIGVIQRHCIQWKVPSKYCSIFFTYCNYGTALFNSNSNWDSELIPFLISPSMLFLMAGFQWCGTGIGEWHACGTSSGFKCMQAGGVFITGNGNGYTVRLVYWFGTQALMPK